MARKISMLAPNWWDFTTLDDELLNDAAKLTAEDTCVLTLIDNPPGWLTGN